MPVAKDSVVEELAAEEPLMEEPVAEKPVPEKPVVKEPSALFMMAASNSFGLPISTTHTIINYIAPPRALSL